MGKVDTMVRRKLVPLRQASMLYFDEAAAIATDRSISWAKTANSCASSKPETLPIKRRRARLDFSTLPRLYSHTGDSGRNAKMGSHRPRKTNWE